MNGKQAKRIKRLVYGKDYSPKFREYRKINAGSKLGKVFPRNTVLTGQIIADPRRQAYQKAKQEYMKTR